MFPARRLSIMSVIALASLLTAPRAHAQAFSAGSTGADGELHVTSDTTLPLDADGVFHFTSVTVDVGATLTFARNVLNTPVQILSQGPILVAGTIDVSGGGVLVDVAEPGLGGPGGFDGGRGLGCTGGIGQGPGGGTFSVTCESTGMPGSFATPGSCAPASAVYGNPLLIPLLGGSGASAYTRCCCGPSGGAGGGGAILLASDVSITVPATGIVRARGGIGSGVQSSGSGGGIRLVAPLVTGVGLLDARGGAHANNLNEAAGGAGRVRIDALGTAGATPACAGSCSVGYVMVTALSPLPSLDIVHVAGRDIPPGSGPQMVVLGMGAPTTQLVRVRATNFSGSVPVRVRILPETGNPADYDLDLDASGDPPEAEVSVTFAPNVPAKVFAWTR